MRMGVNAVSDAAGICGFRPEPFERQPPSLRLRQWKPSGRGLSFPFRGQRILPSRLGRVAWCSYIPFYASQGQRAKAIVLPMERPLASQATRNLANSDRWDGTQHAPRRTRATIRWRNLRTTSSNSSNWASNHGVRPGIPIYVQGRGHRSKPQLAIGIPE